jgi:hypothetical protein
VTIGKLGDTLQAAGELDAAGAAWAEALEILIELDHPAADTVRTKLKSLNAIDE